MTSNSSHHRFGYLRWQNWAIVLVAWELCTLGCASGPYQYGRFQHSRGADETQQVVIEYGKPHKVLDRMAWVVGLPSRILPFHPKVNSHTMSAETSDKLETYLTENDLTDVLVRVNQYDPAGEWRRLRQNRRMSPVWKYSFGTASVIGYTVIPGRVFGGDVYNPFTNSLYVNSDVAAMLIAEAAYAKDIHSREHPGAYAAVNELPVFTLWRYTLAVNETVGYARNQDDWELERETYRTVYPIMGIQAALGGHTAASWVTAMPGVTVPITMVGGAIVGHTVGQTTIAQRERQRQRTIGTLPVSTDHEESVADLPTATDSETGIQLIGFEEIPPLELQSARPVRLSE